MGGEVKAPGIADGPRIMFQEGLDAGQEGGVQGLSLIHISASWLKPSTGTGTPAGDCMVTLTAGDSFLP